MGFSCAYIILLSILSGKNTLKNTILNKDDIEIGKSWIGNCFISKISNIDLLLLVDKWIQKGMKGKYITAINVSKLSMMQKDKNLQEFICNSSINIADGFPIYLATHLLKNPVPEKITGIQLMEDIFQLANDHAYSVFFFGSKPNVLNHVVEKCRHQFPNMVIAGKKDGYFSIEKEPLIVKKIAQTTPDILLIALGVPQKEYFVKDHLHELNAPVLLPVGGAFDVYAGVKKRAPKKVQGLGLEWLWRSFYDPSRAVLIAKSFITFLSVLGGALYRHHISKKRRR